jgi:hypothetical protein
MLVTTPCQLVCLQEQAQAMVSLQLVDGAVWEVLVTQEIQASGFPNIYLYVSR